MRSSDQAAVVQADDIHRLIVSAVQLEQGPAGIERHGIFDPWNTPHFVQYVIRQWNGIGHRIDGTVHDPHLGSNVNDRGRGAGHDPRKHGGHLHHQKDREDDPDEKRHEFGPIVHQKLVGDS